MPKDNPKATVAFVVQYPLQFFILKNIFEKMRDEAEFVVDLGGYDVPHPPQLRTDIERILQANHVPYRVLEYEDYSYETYLERFFGKYVALVSPWERGCISLRCNTERKKIHVVYGAGKDLNNARPTRGIFDCALSYGEHDHVLASYFTNSVIVGNPKFDDWFAGTVDMQSVRHISQRLDPAKKTILYLPTHSDLSSIDSLAPELHAIADTYNVIVKLHYFTPREEPERVKLLDPTSLIVCADEVDLLPLLKLADGVVSDNSSAIFDAILADIPTLVTDFLAPEYLDETHKELRRYRRGVQGALTYSGSIEQTVKKDGSVHVMSKPEELRGKVVELLQDAMPFPDRRARLRAQLFAFNDGKCAERAAAAIRSCIADSEPPYRPILYHVMEAYRRRLGRLSYSRERALRRTIARYQSVVEQRVIEGEPGAVFSVILLADGIYEDALRGLREQRFPADHFEIFIIGAKECRDQSSIAGTRIAHVDAGSLGRSVQEVLHSACGRVVVFLRGDSILDHDALNALYATYARHSDAGGIGGYVRTASRGNPTVTELSAHIRLARILGIEREPAFIRNLFEISNQLPNRNPAGDLAFMSYVRSELPADVSFIQHQLQLEYFLKLDVMRRRPLVFLPTSIVRREPVSLATYLQDEQSRAFFYSMQSPLLRRSFSYQPYRFHHVLSDAAYGLLHMRNFPLTRVLLRAGIARLRGRVLASAARLQQRARRLREEGDKGFRAIDGSSRYRSDISAVPLQDQDPASR